MAYVDHCKTSSLENGETDSPHDPFSSLSFGIPFSKGKKNSRPRGEKRSARSGESEGRDHKDRYPPPNIYKLSSR